MKSTIVELDGKIIHVGAWDYQMRDEMPTNPLPPGAVTSDDVEIVIDSNGARRADVTAPRVQSARVVLARLTPAERAALRACTVPEIQDAYDIALIEGVISETDPDFPAFRTALDQLGIIATSRWPDLLAP